MPDYSQHILKNEQSAEDCKVLYCDGTFDPAPDEKKTCDPTLCYEQASDNCGCQKIEDCDCKDDPPIACNNICLTPSEDNCECVSNPATDNRNIDQCRECVNGQPRDRNRSCQINVCHTRGQCEAGERFLYRI